MQLAKFGDRLEIEILGVDPDGIPNAIRIEYFRNGHQIEGHPAFNGGGCAALRTGALKLISEWWASRWWSNRGYPH